MNIVLGNKKVNKFLEVKTDQNVSFKDLKKQLLRLLKKGILRLNKKGRKSGL